MAWKARVASKTVDQVAGTFAIAVDYFDDVNPGTIIVRRDLSIPAHYSLAEFQSEVVNVGRQERAKYVALAALDSRIAVGTEIAI